MKVGTRLLVATLLLGLVFGLGVQYDIESERHWPYPDVEAVDEAYGRHVGEQVFLFGTVERTDEGADTARIRVEYAGGEFTLTVQGFDPDVRPGGVVQVLGTLRADRVLAAEDVVVVNPAGSSNLYKYAVSLVAALLVVVVFFRYWRVNTETLSFEAR